METAMQARLMIIAAAALTIATSAFAEPAKPHAAQPPQAATPPAEVVLASADTVHETAPSADQPTAPAKRPRVARVTTCRCGDQQAQEQQ
jgi:hypothetical protein